MEQEIADTPPLLSDVIDPSALYFTFNYTMLLETAYHILEQYDLINYHDSVALITNYAVLLTNMGQANEGFSALRKLCHVLRQAGSDRSLDYGIVQEAMGNICAAVGDTEQARIHYKKALAIYEIHFGTEADRIEAIHNQLIKLA